MITCLFDIDGTLLNSGGAGKAAIETALAEAAIGDESDGVCHAAIDFDIRDDTLAFADGIFDAEFAKAEHGEADTEDLTGADVAVGDGGVFEVLVEGFHFWVHGDYRTICARQRGALI